MKKPCHFLLIGIFPLLFFSQQKEPVRIGIIPYAFLSHGTGVYFGKECKDFYPEAKLLYVLPMIRPSSSFPLPIPISRDQHFWQGLALQNTFYIMNRSRKKAFGVTAIARYWWYNNKTVITDDSNPSSSYAIYEKRSARMPAVLFGIDKTYFGKSEKDDFQFYFCAAFGYGMASYKVLGYSVYKGDLQGKPYAYEKRRTLFNLALGFKFGKKIVDEPAPLSN